MLLAPLPDALDIFCPSKVVFILRFAHPPPLACRLRCPPTFRLPAVALPPAIARIADVLFPAMQAVECRVRFHRQAQIEPPNLRKNPASTKKIHAPATPEQDEEQDQGRRALWEAFEENARSEASDFQTGQITGLSNRRPHVRSGRVLHELRDIRKTYSSGASAYSSPLPAGISGAGRRAVAVLPEQGGNIRIVISGAAS